MSECPQDAECPWEAADSYHPVTRHSTLECDHPRYREARMPEVRAMARTFQHFSDVLTHGTSVRSWEQRCEASLRASRARRREATRRPDPFLLLTATAASVCGAMFTAIAFC